MLNQITASIHGELHREAGNNSVRPSIENVKRTCLEACNSSHSSVAIDEEKLAHFATHLDVQKVKSSVHLMDNPTQFPDEHSEVNFLLNLHLFNFGHGFRHSLHNTCGCGAWQTMKKGVFTLHENAKNGFIDAEQLTDLTLEEIDTVFGFPPLNSSPDNENINELRNIILQVAHSTGARLTHLGYASFADFIFDNASSSEPSAQRLVEKLAECFPAFDDRRVLSSGKEVIFLKKAQIAIAELFQKLDAPLAEKISFADVFQFTVACDNVLPCVLKSLGILKLAPQLERKINDRHPLLAGDDEAYLRAAAICATEKIVHIGNNSFWAKELGDFLWSLGKVPEFRKVERHATVNTCFY